MLSLPQGRIWRAIETTSPDRSTLGRLGSPAPSASSLAKLGEEREWSHVGQRLFPFSSRSFSGTIDYEVQLAYRGIWEVRGVNAVIDGE